MAFLPVELTVAERRTLRDIADYQFGAGAGEALFTPDSALSVTRATNGRPRQLHDETGRRVTVGQDGRLTLGFAGGRRLIDALEPPAYRVVVGDESEPFVSDGENAFAKFVQSVDPVIRGGDEVLVVHDQDDRLLAVGRAELSATGMLDFERGMAVKVREGRDEWANRED